MSQTPSMRDVLLSLHHEHDPHRRQCLLVLASLAVRPERPSSATGERA